MALNLAVLKKFAEHAECFCFLKSCLQPFYNKHGHDAALQNLGSPDRKRQWLETLLDSAIQSYILDYND